MKYITTENTSKKDFHQFMMGAIVPRPIALVSSLDSNGIRNLAPFSYFNAVSSIPPIVMVSIGRKPNGDKKDTLINIESTKEFVVNIVNHRILRQMTLASVAYDKEVDEFEMAGFTPISSKRIAPLRIGESPIHLECKLKKIIEFGSGSGESSIVFGDVICLHVNEELIDQNNRISAVKMDVMGRLGRSHYSRILPDTIETIIQAQSRIPIGYPLLPDHIKKSKVLTGNEIAILAASTSLPAENLIKELSQQFDPENDEDFLRLHRDIKKALESNNVELALKLTFLYVK